MASNLSFFSFNTKNSTNLFYINIHGYQPVEYYIIQQKNWMQRARHDFISGKPDVSDSTWMWQRSALAQLRGVHRFVNFVVYYFELFFDAETNGPLTMYWLNRSTDQSGCTYQKFRAPARLALTLYVCRARVHMNRTLAHLLQPSQGLLNKPRPSASQSDHFTQTNRALGLRRGSGMVQNTQCG